MKNNELETYKLIGSKKCQELLSKYSTYRVFWRSGYAWKGAKEVEEDKRERLVEKCVDNRMIMTHTFEERMKCAFAWAAAINVKIDHKMKCIHFNGFSANDLQ